jgi:hypothetical protein
MKALSLKGNFEISTQRHVDFVESEPEAFPVKLPPSFCYKTEP